MANVPPFQNPSPYAAGPPQQPQQKGMSTGTIILIVAICVGVLMMLACGVLSVALLLPAVQQARGAAQNAQQSNQMKEVGLALHMHHDMFKQMPAAINANEAGQPAYSWRLKLAPFVEGQAAFEQFDKQGTWDSAVNLPLQSQAPRAFQAVSGPPGHTNVFAIVDPNAMFVPTVDETTSMRDCIDGLANTAVAVALPNKSVVWTSPQDLTPDEAFQAIQSMGDGERAQLLLMDGFVLDVDNSLDQTHFMALTTRNGKEVVNLP